MKTIIAIMIGLLILLAACNSTPVVEHETIVFEGDSAGIEIVELRIIDDRFDPNTIEVEEGTFIRLFFMNEYPYVFSLPAYNIAVNANGNNMVEFTADKVGEFNYACLDCEDAMIGLLRVE